MAFGTKKWEVIHQLRALVALPEDLYLTPSTHMLAYCSRRPDTFFCSLWVAGMQVVLRQTFINITIFKNLEININISSEFSHLTINPEHVSTVINTNKHISMLINILPLEHIFFIG